MNLFNCGIFHTLILSVTLSHGQVAQFGYCAEVQTVKYFEVEKFLGKWYEIQRYPTWYENNGRCAYKNIQRCGRHIKIEHVYVRDEIKYILHVNSSYNPGDEAIFVIPENNVDPEGIPLSVIATNYKNYAVVFGCSYNQEKNVRYVLAWILSRNQTLSSPYLDISYDALNLIPGTGTVYLENVEQDEEMCVHNWTAHVQAENASQICRGDLEKECVSYKRVERIGYTVGNKLPISIWFELPTPYHT